jgi:hypothetical protein
MSKSRKIFAGALVSALAIGAFTMDAQAGGGHKHRHFKDFHWGVRVVFEPDSCWYYKKRYFKIGRHFWLRKYRECRYGDDD